MKNRTLGSILKAIALAMGIAVVALNVFGSGTVDTSITLLGVGLFCLALWAMQKS